MDFNMEKHYPKTMFAMRALEAAVNEETAMENDDEVRNIAATALAGVAMMLGNVVTGKGAGKATFDGETAKEAITMMAQCLETTLAMVVMEDKHGIN